MPEVDINVWAVILSVVFAMGVGSVWYGPLFGKYWQGLVQLTDEQMKSGAAKAMGVTVILAFIQAYVLAHVIQYTGVTGLVDGLQVGLWMWLGFIFTTHISTAMFDQKNIRIPLLYIANQLVVVLGMAVILTLWQ